jgi:hypothetical protein
MPTSPYSSFAQAMHTLASEITVSVAVTLGLTAGIIFLFCPIFAACVFQINTAKEAIYLRRMDALSELEQQDHKKL